MKILIVSQWYVSLDSQSGIYVPGGTERYAYDLAKQLHDDGYKVNVLSVTMDKDEIGWDVLDGVSVYRFKEPKRFYGYFIDFLSFANTLKAIKKVNPDIIHIVSSRYRFAVGAITAAKIMKKKVVYIRTTLPHKEGRGVLPILFDNLVFTKIIRRVDVIFALSKEMKEALTTIHSKKIVIIPNPPVKDYYKKMAKDHNSVLFVGRLDIATKGVDLLIKALRYVQIEVPNVKLHVCGRGDEKTLSYLSELVSRYKLQKNILFHGHLNYDELVNKYSSCEIIVIPSIREGTASYVLLEAMNAGLPVIASDLDCFSEALGNGKFGVLVKKGDVKGLADQIIKLLKNDRLRKHYSRMSIERSKSYTQVEVVRDIEKVYSDIIGES